MAAPHNQRKTSENGVCFAASVLHSFRQNAEILKAGRDNSHKACHPYFILSEPNVFQCIVEPFLYRTQKSLCFVLFNLDKAFCIDAYVFLL